MVKKSNTKEFIEKAIKIHGDKYDYSLVDYVNNTVKVKIICNKHGVFEQTPNLHLKGNGCTTCGGSLKSNTKEFIEKAIKVHGDKYNYSLVDYVNNATKLKIICKGHGIFEQTPNVHLEGNGCNKCGGTFKSNTKEFIEKAIKVHGDKYNYSLVAYKKSNAKVKIICKVHGIFEQKPNVHLDGCGCNKCSGTFKSNTKEFIEKAIKVHGNKYNYSFVTYNGTKSNVKIICNEHGVFQQQPANHLQGQGCPCCSTFGFDKTKPATLYYLKINNGQAYKIGITNRTVNERFTVSDLKSIEVLKCWEYAYGKEAYKTEQKILKEYSDYRYIGKDLLSSGNTELFSVDILGLDVV